MNYIKSVLEYGGNKFQNTWMPGISFDDLSPITQVYGIVFNDSGEILVCRSGSEDKWQIPGGKPEIGETLEESLKRELIEEVDVTVSKIFPLGAQMVEEEIDGEYKLSSYQLRFVAILDELLDQTVDPDETKNVIWERKFVPSNEVTSYVKWGEIGAAMFHDAVHIFNTKKEEM